MSITEGKKHDKSQKAGFHGEFKPSGGFLECYESPLGVLVLLPRGLLASM